MAFFEYFCSECGETTTKTFSMKEDIPKEVVCERCQGNQMARRVWGNQTIKIPDSFKATNEMYNGDHGANLDYISNRMKHGKRPSGRDRIYY